MYQELIRNATIGGVAAIAETFVNHPLFTIKNMMQSKDDDNPFQGDVIAGIQNFGLFNSVKYIYTGFGSNMLQMVPVTAIQVCVFHAITEMIIPMGVNIGIAQVLGGSIGGMVSALVSGPTELIIKQQRKRKDEISTAIKNGTASQKDLEGITFLGTAQALIEEHGYSVLATGMFGIACRDGLFTCGYMALIPLAQAAFIAFGAPYLLAVGLSTVSMGVLVSLLSQPFDLIATQQQQIDFKKDTILDFYDTAMQIYHEENFYYYFKGGTARSLRVISGSFIIGSVESTLQSIVPK